MSRFATATDSPLQVVGGFWAVGCIDELKRVGV
jgi:hypothetical protein